MFAPPVAKPKSKTAASSTNKLAFQRSRFGCGAFEQQASLTENEPDAHAKEADAASTAARETAPRLSWDFSKIPLIPPGGTNQPQDPFLFGGPRLPHPIQAKLKVGAVDDPLEHEADRVADQVMRMPAPEVATTPAPPRVSRKCDACEEEEKLQKKPAGPQAATGEAPGIVHEVLRAPGQPLDAATRAYFEPRFGQDFSGVRLHTDARAAESARAVNAVAYTTGRHIVFSAGANGPKTVTGRKLLAHELTHTIQQTSHSFAMAQGAAILQRAPVGGSGKLTTDPRPLIQYPEKGPPVVEVVSEGARSIEWSWEIQRSGNESEQIYWAHFEVDANGVMTVSARMVNPSAGLRAPEWTLRDKFQEALEIFSIGGIEVRAFDAEWGYMNPHEISTNLDAFFGSLRANPGQPLDKAARITPSGKVAIENGFTDVSVQDIGAGVGGEHLQPPNQSIKHVRPGVRVRFAKPGTGEIIKGEAPPPKPTGGTSGGAGTSKLEANAPPTTEPVPAKGGPPPALPKATPAPTKTEPTTETKTTEQTTEPVITADVGPPLEPVYEGGPSAKGEAIGGGVIVGAQIKDAIMGHFGDKKQAARADAAWAPKYENLLAVQKVHPELGAWVTTYWQVGRGNEGETSRIFMDISVKTGTTEKEAKESPEPSQLNLPDPAYTESDGRWIPPLRQLSLAEYHTPQPKIAIATFAPGRAVLQDVSWGGPWGGKFNKKGTTELDVPFGVHPKFAILQPPTSIYIEGYGNVGIETGGETTREGYVVPVVSDLQAALVFALDLPTLKLLDQGPGTKDTTDQLGSDFQLMRWVPVKDIMIDKALSGEVTQTKAAKSKSEAFLRFVHDEVAAIRTGLMTMAKSGSAYPGMLVAIDHLKVAQQTTDLDVALEEVKRSLSDLVDGPSPLYVRLMLLQSRLEAPPESD